MTDPNIERKTDRERETNTVVVDRRDGGNLAIIGVVVAVLVVLAIGYFWITGSQDSSVNVNVTEESAQPPEVQAPTEQPAPETVAPETVTPVTPETTTPAPVAPPETAPEQTPPASQ